MSLLDELKSQLIGQREERDREKRAAEIHMGFVAAFDRRISELETAIAALSPPAPTADAGEPEIPEGFIKWEGGDCPVDRDACVEVMFRDRSANDKDVAYLCDWRHHDVSGTDIIAYRVIAEPAQTDAASDAPPADDTPRTLILDPLADPDLSSSDPLVSETGEGLEPDAELELTDVVRADVSQYPDDVLDTIIDGMTPNEIDEVRGYVYGDEPRMDVTDRLHAKGLLKSASCDAPYTALGSAVSFRLSARFSGCAANTDAGGNADPARDDWAMAPKAKEPV